MEEFLSYGEIVLRTLFAVVGGGALGWQRELHGKPAGLRTQMLVALGAASFTILALELYESSIESDRPHALDPMRVIQGVIAGVGFLGAGTIIEARGSVKGLTTAATIWVVAALGVACGLGYYVLAGTTFGFTLLILVAMKVMEDRLIGSDSKKTGHNERTDPSQAEPPARESDT
ncbi:MAG: MgtC/SapB family protein [Planctomycetota bacterium]